MKQLAFIFMLAIIGTNMAFGAQCKFVPTKQADMAKKHLEKLLSSNKATLAVIDSYCESCLDKYAKAVVVEKVSVVNTQVRDYKSVVVNDSAIDLAYIYINGENLAKIIGCRTFGVSEYL